MRALTERRIRDAALRIIDEEGLTALSMRCLAAALEVDPMSIYHHVPSKDALLTGVIELVVAEHAPTDRPHAPWQDRVRSWARQYRALAMAHPNLVLALVADTAAVSRLAAPALEPLYSALVAGGIAPPEIVDVADTVVDYVHGFVLAESAQASGPGFDRGHMLKDIDEATLPNVAQVLRSLPPDELHYDFDTGFERAIDLILVGMAGYRRGADRSPADPPDDGWS